MNKCTIMIFLIYNLFSHTADNLEPHDILDATWNNDVAKMEKIFNSGIELNIKHKTAALFYAVENMSRISFTREYDLDNQEKLLSYKNNMSIIELLLVKGADPNWNLFDPSYTLSRYSPSFLFYAIDSYNSTLTALLLAHGANALLIHPTSKKLPIEHAYDKCCPSDFKTLENQRIIQSLEFHMNLQRLKQNTNPISLLQRLKNFLK